MPAPIWSWIYISRTAIASGDVQRETDSIVSLSKRRNSSLNVTGALLSTEERFAQYLEGPFECVRTLMASIKRDSRHRDLITLLDRPVSGRRFDGWSLAFAGPSNFVSRIITRSLLETGFKDEIALTRLIGLMEEFTRADDVQA